MKPSANRRMPRKELDEWQVGIRIRTLENIFKISDRLMRVE
jgi:hypothetical protein